MQDVVMGEVVCLKLRSLTQQSPPRIVMSSVHAPSSRMFDPFTHALVLTSKGHLAFHGEKDKVIHMG